jgi:hypothetical protein
MYRGNQEEFLFINEPSVELTQIFVKILVRWTGNISLPFSQVRQAYRSLANESRTHA